MAEKEAKGEKEAKVVKEAKAVKNVKDAVEKTLEENNDVFSDLLNVFVYQGTREIARDALESAASRSVYKADGRIREQERDVAKYWRNVKFRIAMFGVENQTEAEDDMPLRVIGYDGAAYRDQIYFEKDGNGKWSRNRNPRYPVVTLVLYFGYRKHWDKALSLYEALADFPEELRPYVNDYRVNLVEVAWLTDEQLELFQSDFKILADYFVQMRKNGTYVPSRQQAVHMQEVLQTMGALLHDDRFERAYQEAEGEEKPRNMCEVLDIIENRGIAKGEMKWRTLEYIDLRREYGHAEDDILQGIMEKFNLSQEQAEKYMSGET